ncbi:hypothetical protein LLB_3734 [Legionella longbeachae D-4968]|nr:hypothetical protein LLB_3734 [Legionella longbeachae D-4968]
MYFGVLGSLKEIYKFVPHCKISYFCVAILVIIALICN